MEITLDLQAEEISELMRSRMVVRDPGLHLRFVNALIMVGPLYENPTNHGPRLIPKVWEVDGQTLEGLINSRQAIKAIKCMRAHAPGLGLKQAKDIYDGLIK